MKRIWGQGKEMGGRERRCGAGKRKGSIVNNQRVLIFAFCSHHLHTGSTIWSSIQACEPTSPSVQMNDTNLIEFVVVLNEKNGWHTVGTQ